MARYGNRVDHAVNLASRFGLTLAEYDAMYAKQNGLCAICGKPETTPKRKGGKARPLGVDHCHKTGAIRGLLCATCNNGLGCFKDDAVLLHAALKYLAEHPTDQEG